MIHVNHHHRRAYARNPAVTTELFVDEFRDSPCNPYGLVLSLRLPGDPLDHRTGMKHAAFPAPVPLDPL
jgi:hypothetical protein